MTAPSVAGDGDDPYLPLPEASGGVLGPADGTAPRLLLSDEQHRRECVLAAAIAIEFIRVVAPSDSRTTARYAATTVDNSRALCAGSPRLHLSLLRRQLKWLRGLPVGASVGTSTKGAAITPA
jgi:hypothetical protein